MNDARPGDAAPDAQDPADEPAGQASAFRRALDAQAEVEDPAQTAANPQTRIPAWMPRVHAMRPPPDATAEETTLITTQLIPAQLGSPDSAPMAEAVALTPSPAMRGAQGSRRRLPLTIGIGVVVAAAIALVVAFAGSSGSPKAAGPIALPTTSAAGQAPAASTSDSVSAGASCASGQGSSCAATPSPTAATPAASPSSASPLAQGAGSTPHADPSTAGSSPTKSPLGTSNLALNRSVTASGYTQTYAPANAVDGNTSSYWESTDNAFPQWYRIDLGSATTLGALVIDLPPSSAWGTRTQTILIQGSTNGSTYSTITAAAGYTFNPATGNTVTIDLPAGTSARYVQLTFTANTGWPAGQMSELEIFG